MIDVTSEVQQLIKTSVRSKACQSYVQRNWGRTFSTCAVVTHSGAVPLPGWRP